MFYKAVVQFVLLFGSETWALTESLRVLEGFHIRSAYRATVNVPRKLNNNTWVYPKNKDVLEEVGLFTIREYIEMRRQTIANTIVDRPIFKLCLDQEPVRGTVPHLWWWEQSIDIDLSRVGGDDLAVVDKSDLDLEVFAHSN